MKKTEGREAAKTKAKSRDEHDTASRHRPEACVPLLNSFCKFWNNGFEISFKKKRVLRMVHDVHARINRVYNNCWGGETKKII